jgi:hypothetical protein
MALMFASMISIYGRAIRGNLGSLFAFAAVLVFAAVTLACFGLVYLACDLGDSRCAHKRARLVRPFLKRLFTSRVPLSDEHRL